MLHQLLNTLTDKLHTILSLILLGVSAFSCTPSTSSTSPTITNSPEPAHVLKSVTAVAPTPESAQSTPLSYPPANPTPITTTTISPASQTLESRTMIATQVNENGKLIITLNNDKDVIINCLQDTVKINGNDPDDREIICTSVTAVLINGSPGNNNISLGGLTRIAFPNLNEVIVNGNGGNDSFTASEFSDTLTGGNGDDAFIGTQPNDVVDPGDGQNFFMEATQPLGEPLSAPAEDTNK
ncbi:MAG: hypothetical protein GY796_00525 [Chloroflexi bacterium]|nr:hypothetical protein [Chloroflexota bacterium]